MNHSLKTAVLMLGATSALVATPVFAQAQPQPGQGGVAGEIKLNPQLPTGSTVQTDLTSTGPGVQNKPQEASGQASANLGGPLVPQGLPTVPGVENAAAGDSPAQAEAPATQPLTKNFVPGQPVPTYATLAEAAAAGIEPLPELSLKGEPASEAPVQTRFNWADPHAYLAWVQSQLAGPGGYVAGGAFVLLGAAWLWLRNRRANAAWDGADED